LMNISEEMNEERSWRSGGNFSVGPTRQGSARLQVLDQHWASPSRSPSAAALVEMSRSLKKADVDEMPRSGHPFRLARPVGKVPHAVRPRRHFRQGGSDLTLRRLWIAGVVTEEVLQADVIIWGLPDQRDDAAASSGCEPFCRDASRHLMAFIPPRSDQGAGGEYREDGGDDEALHDQPRR
jgi:hypothetical protein